MNNNNNNDRRQAHGFTDEAKKLVLIKIGNALDKWFDSSKQATLKREIIDLLSKIKLDKYEEEITNFIVKALKVAVPLPIPDSVISLVKAIIKDILHTFKPDSVDKNKIADEIVVRIQKNIIAELKRGNIPTKIGGSSYTTHPMYTHFQLYGF